MIYLNSLRFAVPLYPWVVGVLEVIASMLGYSPQKFALTWVTFKMNTTKENLLLISRGPDKFWGGEGEWSDGLRLWV